MTTPSEEIARYADFIDVVVRHFARGRAELIDKACQASLADPEKRGVLVQDWDDKTVVMLSRTVEFGSVGYRDYREAKAPATSRGPALERVYLDEASAFDAIQGGNEPG